MAKLQATRAAIWSRVSTDEQKTENQIPVLRSFAEARGFSVVVEYNIQGESAYSGNHRPHLEKAIEDARQGKFDVLLTWDLSRLSREGMEATLAVMRRFQEFGVRVISIQEPFTELPGIGELLVGIFAWKNREDSRLRSERVKAGLARRVAEGKPIGRQPGAKDAKRRKRSGYVARWERERDRAS